MPWHVTKSSDCPASKPWAVIKDSDGSVEGCHATEADAMDQMKALYANEPMMASAHLLSMSEIRTIEQATHPLDNLVRSSGAARTRSDGEAGRTLFGHFAVFDTWTEINSIFEGRFLERIAPGAFADSIRNRRDQIKVLYDHGGDPQLGNKPLGPIEVLREDSIGAYYEVPLLDVPALDHIAAAADAGLLGASFRFKVTRDEWASPSEPSPHNPQTLDERTIRSVDLYEFGPVTFPAYADATAAMRSRTDEFLERFLNDPWFVARFTERVGNHVETVLSALPPPAQDEERQQQDDEAALGAEPFDEDPNRVRRLWWAQRLERFDPQWP